MAFELSLIVGSTTYSLSDGNPYSVQDVVGLGLPPVQRFSARYPRQDGYDDSGYVLEPRVVTLALSFVATTASALDGYRDDLMAMFSPGVTATLQVERDDGTTRRVDVVTTSAPQITLDPAHRPGNLHRAVVQLRAADPIWYAPSPGTVTFGTTDTSIWYLASSSIDESAVLEATTTPGSAQAWSWGTATQGGGNLTVAFRGTIDNSGIERTAWEAVETGGDTLRLMTFESNAIYGDALVLAVYPDVRYYSLGEYPNEERSVILSFDGGYLRAYVDTTNTFSGWVSAAIGFAADDASSSWRDGLIYPGWPPAMSHAATYNIALSQTQAQALANAMAGTLESYALGATVPYAGNYDDLPVITLTGPLGDPVVTNVATSRKLDFTGSTIPAGVTYTIDLGRDTLSVVDQGGTIHTDELTDDSDLGSWAIIAGRSNFVQITAATSGTASAAQIVYRNRYVSY